VSLSRLRWGGGDALRRRLGVAPRIPGTPGGVDTWRGDPVGPDRAGSGFSFNDSLQNRSATLAQGVAGYTGEHVYRLFAIAPVDHVQ